MVKPITHIILLLFTAVLCFPAAIFSQDASGNNDELGFFEERARKDAKIEQSLQLSLTEDEIDYWKDQRNFEKGLKKLSYKGYQAYIKVKWIAYSEHEVLCNTECGHGEFYQAQASFYSKYGTKDNSLQLSSISEGKAQQAKLLAVQDEQPQ
jgi:hypothetical protein